MLPAPDTDPSPAPPPAASLGSSSISSSSSGSSSSGGAFSSAGWSTAWSDARELLHLFLQGPEGKGWEEFGSGAAASGAGGVSEGLLGLLLGRGRGGAGEMQAAAAAAAALQADGEVAAAVALLRVLPRGTVRALQGLAGGGGGSGGGQHAGLQMMCIEAEALSMCC